MEAYFLKINLTGNPNIKKWSRAVLVEWKWKELSFFSLLPGTLNPYNLVISPEKNLIISTFFALIFGLYQRLVPVYSPDLHHTYLIWLLKPFHNPVLSLFWLTKVLANKYGL